MIGQVDVDSIPGNYKPEGEGKFVPEGQAPSVPFTGTSTPSINNYWEDDTWRSPTLNIWIPETRREMTGKVWDDKDRKWL